MKKWLIIFIYGFLLNLVWENLHSALYLHYKNGPITGFILLRAALVDAFIILILIWLLRGLPFKFFHRPWAIILLGVIVAIFVEQWALNTGRWTYTEIMPIIPIINTGLTPTLQLGLLGYITYKLIFKRRVKSKKKNHEQ